MLPTHLFRNDCDGGGEGPAGDGGAEPVDSEKVCLGQGGADAGEREA